MSLLDPKDSGEVDRVRLATMKYRLKLALDAWHAAGSPSQTLFSGVLEAAANLKAEKEGP
jgi:hypothetical protein